MSGFVDVKIVGRQGCRRARVAAVQPAALGSDLPQPVVAGWRIIDVSGIRPVIALLS
jgi:hypothetical protein